MFEGVVAGFLIGLWLVMLVMFAVEFVDRRRRSKHRILIEAPTSEELRANVVMLVETIQR